MQGQGEWTPPHPHQQPERGGHPGYQLIAQTVREGYMHHICVVFTP